MLATISSKVVEFFVEKTLEQFLKIIPSIKKDGISINEIDLPRNLRIHYSEMINWSFDIPFIGLSQRKNVAENTIELNISSRLSKYGKDKSEVFFSEQDILNTYTNIIVLGKPGAGKTTTLKRLINAFFSKKERDSKFTNPILLKLRELNTGGDIYSSILSLFNISTEVISTTEEIDFNENETNIAKKVIRINKIYIKDTNILAENFVADLLNEINSILFLDGFDEISSHEQSKVLRDAKKLGIRLSNAKIILTSRTSSLNSKVVEGFDIYEIQPLDNEDVKVISDKWLGAGTDFIEMLYDKPYHELSNRPIYLTLLLVLYERNQSLPLSPFEIYREAIYLIIRDWDEGRDIIRLSKYASFNVRKKLDFLQEVAFLLTYQTKSNVFSSDLLFDIYNTIHEKYLLPKGEMKEVIAEIESHNGLISEAGYKLFEFSHLTLQEYLCAEYLVSLPYSKNTITYFFERPDPLAVAICISKDSGLWLSNLLLNENLNVSNYKKDKLSFELSLAKLLSRLIDEAPIFNPSVELGATMIYLLSNFQKKEYIIKLIFKIMRIKNVTGSVKMFISDCEMDIRQDLKLCFITRNVFSRTDNFISLPYYERIDLVLWKKVESLIKKFS